MKTFEFRVHGVPAPKGSKRAFMIGGQARVVDANTKTKPWEQDVKFAALEVLGDDHVPFEHAVKIKLTYYLPRPKTLAKKWFFPEKKPDMDKLNRAVWDAITAAGVWRDDSLVVEEENYKRYATDKKPAGVEVSITALTDE